LSSGFVKNFYFFSHFADIQVVKLDKGEYLTVKNMASILNLDAHTVVMRLKRAGISPLSTDPLYPASALSKISNSPGKGRPKKTKDKAQDSDK
jgi:hypothetical protein